MLKECLSYRPETYEVEMDGSTMRYKAFLIACGNASQYGNNAYIAPQATLNDGLLDVTILEPFTMLDIPALAFQLFNRTINQNSRIKTFRCKSLKIHRHKAGVAHYDGDPVTMGEHIEVKIVQQGLKVLAPLMVKKEKEPAKVLQKAQEYIHDLKQKNEALVEDIAHKNKVMLEKINEKLKMKN